MCGIAGFVGRGGKDDLVAMTRALARRGPDAQGLWCDTDRAIYLGHRRLSIIDLSGGAQPMWTLDGELGVVFNGEIYNHLELRATLVGLGHRFTTDHSDTEVLLHGYRQWGLDLPNRLNGMWAFALYDKRNQTLLLSRDRFGKKPLFYSRQRGTFAFASELTALTEHKGMASNISARSLKKYFAYGFIPAPSSVFESIHKLPGGSNLLLRLADMEYSITKYWTFRIEPFERIPADPEQEWGEELRCLLKNAVKRRLMSDVPLGVFLSGGIDSSSVAAFATVLSSQRIKSFSIAFTEASFDESAYSSRVASLLNTEHHVKTFSLAEASTLLPEISRRLDEPMGDSSLLPTFLLCRETRREVTVAVGGDGADELFAGYDPFRALRLARLYSRIVPQTLHQSIALLAARLPTSYQNMSIDFRIKRTLRGLNHEQRLWNAVWLGPLSPTELTDLFQEPVDIEDLYSEAIECWDANPHGQLVDKTLEFYTKLYLQDAILVKVDRASMMNSLEVRSPYLDIDLVDFVRRIPHSYKYRRGRTKYILKRALEPLLPKEILHRPKKGFGIPIAGWFKDGHLAFDHGLPSLNGLSPSFLASRLREQQSGTHDHRLYLWNHWLLTSFLASHPDVDRRSSLDALGSANATPSVTLSCA